MNDPSFRHMDSPVNLGPPSCMPRPDRHNEIELNWLGSGSLTYLLGGRRITIHAGSLVLFWAAIPHQIVEFDRHVPYFVVTIPLTEFMRAGIDREFVNRALLGELLIDTALDESEGHRFAVWEKDLKSQSPILERATQLEVRTNPRQAGRPMSATKASPRFTKSGSVPMQLCSLGKNSELHGNKFAFQQE